MYWTNTKTLWLYTRDGFGDIAVGAPGKHLDGLHVKEFNDGDLMVVMIMMNKMIVRRMIIVAKNDSCEGFYDFYDNDSA